MVYKKGAETNMCCSLLWAVRQLPVKSSSVYNQEKLHVSRLIYSLYTVQCSQDRMVIITKILRKNKELRIFAGKIIWESALFCCYLSLEIHTAVFAPYCWSDKNRNLKTSPWKQGNSGEKIQAISTATIDI